MSPPQLTAALHERRERVFLILAGTFIGAMAMLNIIGITRFVQLGPFSVAVGVLPYPLTFLCTDLISELYGRRRANFVVLTGLLVNLLVIGTIWLGQSVPSVEAAAQAPWQNLVLAEPVGMPNGSMLGGDGQSTELFTFIYACTAGAVLASMCAYMAAQFCDVALFHFWKRLTKGKHLWLRNNGSTLVSQLVDTTMVVAITFGAAYNRGDMELGTMLGLIRDGYLFKMTVALVDTIPVYVLVAWLSKYLEIDPNAEHNIDVEETTH